MVSELGRTTWFSTANAIPNQQPTISSVSVHCSFGARSASHRYQAKFEDAEALDRQVLELRQTRLGRDNAMTVTPHEPGTRFGA
jgi:hypothetical protein